MSEKSTGKVDTDRAGRREYSSLAGLVTSSGGGKGVKIRPFAASRKRQGSNYGVVASGAGRRGFPGREPTPSFFARGLPTDKCRFECILPRLARFGPRDGCREDSVDPDDVMRMNRPIPRLPRDRPGVYIFISSAPRGMCVYRVTHMYV